MSHTGFILFLQEFIETRVKELNILKKSQSFYFKFMFNRLSDLFKVHKKFNKSLDLLHITSIIAIYHLVR